MFDLIKELVWGFYFKLYCPACSWKGRAINAKGRVSWGLKYLSCPKCAAGGLLIKE